MAWSKEARLAAAAARRKGSGAKKTTPHQAKKNFEALKKGLKTGKMKGVPNIEKREHKKDATYALKKSGRTAAQEKKIISLIGKGMTMTQAIGKVIGPEAARKHKNEFENAMAKNRKKAPMGSARTSVYMQKKPQQNIAYKSLGRKVGPSFGRRK